VSICVKEGKCFNKIGISHHFREQDMEICVIQLETKTSLIILNILCKYILLHR
jgi:hypothetical protein